MTFPHCLVFSIISVGFQFQCLFLTVLFSVLYQKGFNFNDFPSLSCFQYYTRRVPISMTFPLFLVFSIIPEGFQFQCLFLTVLFSVLYQKGFNFNVFSSLSCFQYYTRRVSISMSFPHCLVFSIMPVGFQFQ